jgi:hypothetical protein
MLLPARQSELLRLLGKDTKSALAAVARRSTGLRSQTSGRGLEHKTLRDQDEAVVMAPAREEEGGRLRLEPGQARSRCSEGALSSADEHAQTSEPGHGDRHSLGPLGTQTPQKQRSSRSRTAISGQIVLGSNHFRSMLLCLSRPSFLHSGNRRDPGFAECGRDRDGPLAVEGRLLSGHEVSRSERSRGGRQIVRRPARGCGSRIAGQAAPGGCGV